MNCSNCGKPLNENATFCDRCGASVPQEYLPQMPAEHPSGSKGPNTPIVILLILILAAIIGFGIYFALRSSGGDTSPAAESAQTDASDPTQPSAPTIAETAQPATDSGEQSADAAVKATEAPFTISQKELEIEIEKIRKWYYSPTSDDEKLVLENGEDGWNYSRDYRFHNGKLVFAFIFDGTEEHRLYFKDDHMIRYIDENHTAYDYPDCDKFSSWAEKALREAYAKYSGGTASDTDESGWIGTWKNDAGATMTITAVTASGFDVVYHHTTEQGSWIDSTYHMVFTDSSHLTATESADNASWKYTLTLSDGYLLVESRYPDMKFYKE